jgi:hypothetical protein
MDTYPHGLDVAWLAVDASDHVAVFQNAGQGPIPGVVLADYPHTIPTDRLIRDLPLRGDSKLLISLPSPGYFKGLARRGLFAYDWQDVHRAVNHTKSYELLAIPSVPIILAELPEQLRELATRVRFASVRFGHVDRLLVADVFECQ